LRLHRDLRNERGPLLDLGRELKLTQRDTIGFLVFLRLSAEKAGQESK
jgi:hypothetical protein